MRERFISLRRYAPLLLALAVLGAVTPVSASPVIVTISQWEGAASPIPCPCPPPDPGPLDYLADLHSFAVDYGPGNLTVSIDWSPAVLEDLDLYIDRQDDGGNWVLVAFSVNGDTIGDQDDSSEMVAIQDPAPGRYRARIHNWLSVETAYHGEALFFTTG
jgi:pre-peptidase